MTNRVQLERSGAQRLGAAGPCDSAALCPASDG